MRVGSLFSGIGGLDLGLERAGMTVAWQSEIDPYCCRVLAKHWPDVPNIGDVTSIDWSTVEPVDIICGGYPCQPFSLAGARAGEADRRHLWPYFADALRHLRPRYALLENVPGHLSLGFGRVLGDLAELGFDAEWQCIPAAAVGAPHLRYRIFVVATNTERVELRQQPVAIFGRGGASVVGDDGTQGAVAHTNGEGQPQPGRTLDGVRRRPCDGGASCSRSGLADPDSEGPQERRARWAAHYGHHWAVEPDVGRVANGVRHRVDRLRALGNAVVPQVAQLVGERIMKAAA